MRPAYAAFVVAGLCSGTAIAAPPAIPDTPAGHALETWLEAFNSGDTDRVQACLKIYESKKTPVEMLALRHQTGGFELIGIDKSERTRIEFTVKEKGSSQTAVGRIEVKDAVPPEVVTFRIRRIPPWGHG